MIRRLALLLLLTGCSGQPTSGQQPSDTEDLETAAIERGIIGDPGSTEIDGLYARDTDRLCIVGQRVGLTSDYGEGLSCNAAGTVKRSGDQLTLTVGDGCTIAARWDGRQIVFPPNVDPACNRLCTGRASLAAFAVERLSDSVAEAAAMRDSQQKLPCSG